MSHYSWTKDSRTLDKKLNGKKTNEIKKFYWERDVFKPSKVKKVIIYKENDFGFISEIKNLTFQYPKYQLGFFWISRSSVVVLNMTWVFPLKEKSSQKMALNVAHVVVLV